MKNIITISAWIKMILVIIVYWTILPLPQVTGQLNHYETAICIHNEYPSDTEPAFANNIQGIAQDGAHWYITQTKDLWKIPMSMSWDDVMEIPLTEGVLHTELIDYIIGTPNVSAAYNHMGDLAYHPSGVLIVPLHGDDEITSAMLIVDADDLDGISWRDFHTYNYKLAGFCADDENGNICFPGAGDFDEIVAYGLHPTTHQFTPDPEYTIKLVKENGTPHRRHHKQGGVFSPSGELFVMSTGYGEGDDSDPVLDGIHVFDTTVNPWKRIAHSTNGYGMFNYMWNPADEEPEGMTWIDLDNSSYAGMWGQLHILLLNNDDADSDNIYFKHYTHRLYVSHTWPLAGTGRKFDPYQTVAPAANQAWDGCEIYIAAGNYPESATFDKRLKIIPQGGTVRIGATTSLIPPKENKKD